MTIKTTVGSATNTYYEEMGIWIGKRLWEENETALLNFLLFLTCKFSAALIRDVIWSWPTLISPLYMKSTIACISQPCTSLRTITGCLHGVSEKIFWKYGLGMEQTNNINSSYLCCSNRTKAKESLYPSSRLLILRRPISQTVLRIKLYKKN